MITIRTSNRNLYGLSTILPVDGRTKIDQSGKAEVSEECWEALKEHSYNWSKLSSDGQEEFAAANLEGTELRKSLLKMKKREVKVIAEKYGIETENKTKAHLIDDIEELASSPNEEEE